MSGGGGNIYDFGASQTLADIIKQQYANYQAIYQPIENQQIAWATNPATIGNAQTGALANALTGSQAAAVGLRKSLEGAGTVLTPDQNAAVQKRLGLQRGLSEVEAMNRAGTSTYDTITNVLSGGAPNVAGLVKNVNTSGATGLGG